MTVNIPSPRSWLTSFCGVVIGLASTLKLEGFTIGHVGKGDYIDLAITLATAGLGLAAKDFNTHSTQGEVQQASEQVPKPAA